MISEALKINSTLRVLDLSEYEDDEGIGEQIVIMMINDDESMQVCE